MSVRPGDLGKALEGILAERKKMARAERKVVRTLIRAVGRIGYRVVAKTEPESERRRRARKKVAAEAPAPTSPAQIVHRLVYSTPPFWS